MLLGERNTIEKITVSSLELNEMEVNLSEHCTDD